jgi:hypothetical protein
MALILFGGFEMGNFNGEFSGVEVPVVVPFIANGSNSIIAGGRSGAFQNRLQRNTYGAFADRTSFYFPAPLSEFFFQVALASEHVGKYCGADWQIIRWTKDGTVLGGIWYRYTTDVMEVYTGNFATLVGSFPAPPGNSVYWIFEIHLIIGASGLIEIRRDMNPVFTFSGNTKPGADTAVNTFEVGSLANYDYLRVDDFVLTDPTGPAPLNSWPGGLRIACLMPNTDDGLNQWTPTPGPTHYTAVDELPPSETDYLTATSVDLEERFGLTDLPVTAQVVHAVKVIASAKKESANAPDKIAVGLNIGGTPYYSGDMLLLTTIAGAVKQWIGHPAGGPLSVADVNGAKLLLKARG